MPIGHARKSKVRIVKRATRHLVLAAAFTLIGSKGLHTAVANGDTRTISLHHTHRGDDITVTFKRNGRYDDDGLKKLNHFLRDWRTDDATNMDPQLFDAVWEVQREFGLDKPLNIISSYRSPRTNEMLRKRSSGVARHSLHMQGKAMDFFIPGVPLDKVREAGLRLQRGGVGFYPTSGSPFVHMDVGNVRHWPRMTREQLARVFPDGRTVHLPTDGKPLAGFALAQADLAKRGSNFDQARLASADTKVNPLARLFGFKPKSAEDEDEGESAKPAAEPTQVASAFPKPVGQRVRDNIFAALQTEKPALAQAAIPAPLPKARPAAAPAQVALSEPNPPRPPAPIAGTFALAAITPNDVIMSRGYWSGRPDVGEASTGSIGPFAAPPGYGEGKPGESLLSYAKELEPESAPQRAKSAAPQAARIAPVAPNTTVASKARSDTPTIVHSATPMSEAQMATERRFEGPWMRALILTPSVERFMTTTLYGAPDFRSLQPLLRTPTAMVVMAFASEPQAGLSHGRFQGRAIEFVATATFLPRTAALR